MHGALALNRIVVVDDHVLFAEVVDAALRMEGYDVARVDLDDRSVSTPQLLTRIRTLRPGIVLLDLDLGRGGDTTDFVQPLTQAGVAVVVVTASKDRLRWGECLRYGARAVLPKSTQLESLRETVRLIANGRSLPGRRERDELVAAYHHEEVWRQATRARLDRLSCREREVLGHLMAGRVVREIAQVSYVSEATVREQIKSILAKLEVTSQLAAVSAAHATDWTPPVAAVQLA
jgi:two-component system, NarL family, nitrate/nitrite response regulator NarL